MKPNEVHQILRNIGVTNLHHANTVTTSCTFLEQGGLLSRSFVEDRHLIQTPQYSDAENKNQNVWEWIFLDHVDIHAQTGRNKGHNQYGPVLFVFNLDLLLTLPAGSEVFVTRYNFFYWQSKSNDQRWTRKSGELARNISLGDLNKIIVIKTPSGKIDFQSNQVRIILDDPQRSISRGGNAYLHAEKQLKKAAITGKVKALIEKRQCDADCVCLKKYATKLQKHFDLFYT